MNAPIPAEEAKRLAMIDAMQIEFSQPNMLIQSLCDLAARVAGSEIALVSIIKDEQQEFIAQTGIEGLTTSPRQISFCAHAIVGPEQLVVTNATKDKRFKNNPMVTDGLRIRSYVGSVLEPSDGLRIGTISVVDTKPRQFSLDTLSQLRTIAEAITALLMGHRDRKQLNKALVESKRRERHVLKAAQTDALTGLCDGAYFRMKVHDRLHHAKQPAAFVLMDADRFKLVNDFYGHAFGDKYLKVIAQTLLDTVPDHALIGRLGGDEFAVFIEGPDAEKDALSMLLNRCLVEIRKASAALGKHDLGYASFGASLFPGHARGFEELYINADVALYDSKNNGRNRVTIYNDRLGERRNLRALRADFDFSRKYGRIFPFYQPKIVLENGEVSGFEALCRWEHPERGLLTPEAFGPLLQDFKTAPAITSEILRQVCDDYAHLHEQGVTPGRIAVNFTVYDLQNPESVQDFDFYLCQSGLKWKDLTIEVTEHVVMGDIEGVIFQTLQAFRTRGAKIALDDFGTGYGGLQHLKSWPVDMIKIDGSFVSELPSSTHDLAIVRSVISLANALGIEVVAEGVETAEQAAALRDMGCHKAQGYFFARPMPASDMLSFLQTSSAA